MSRRFAFHSPGRAERAVHFQRESTRTSDLPTFCSASPINSRMDVTQFFNLHRFYFSWFVQDNWRVHSKLSINIGLRNDSITPWKERHDRVRRGSFPENGGTLVPVGTAPFEGGPFSMVVRGNSVRDSGSPTRSRLRP